LLSEKNTQQRPSLPSVFLALGKAASLPCVFLALGKKDFAECFFHSAKHLLCRVFFLPSVFIWHSVKSFFVECLKKTLGKPRDTRQRTGFR
jgi:hypothetical protein